MSTLFRNNSPGALTREQAVALVKKRIAARRAAQRKAAALAAEGRGGDTEIAHVTVGEIVLPHALQTPEVLAVLRQAAINADIPLDRLRVGSVLNSINPQSGRPEFFDFSLWPKGVIDPCNQGAQMERCEGWIPNFLKDKPSTYMPTPEDLARLPDAQKQRYAEYYEGTSGFEGVLGTGLGGIGRMFGPVRNVILRGAGKAADHDAATREEIAKAYRDAIGKPPRRP